MTDPSMGRLLLCPNCNRVGKKQILGRVIDDGSLLVLRFHHGTTICRSEEYSVVCGCGFQFDISGTVVTENYPSLQVEITQTVFKVE